MLGKDMFGEGLFGDGNSEALEDKEARLWEVLCCICSLLFGEVGVDLYLVLSRSFSALLRPARFSFLLFFLFFLSIFFKDTDIGGAPPI